MFQNAFAAWMVIVHAAAPHPPGFWTAAGDGMRITMPDLHPDSLVWAHFYALNLDHVA